MPKTKMQVAKLLSQYKDTDLVFYESPNRILKTLNFICGCNPNAKVAIGRELTKVFEEVIVDDVKNIITHFENNQPKGEFVALVFRNKNSGENIDIDEKINLLKKNNFSSKDIKIILSTLYNFKKNEIYKLVLK